jgi:hypothetical protein
VSNPGLFEGTVDNMNAHMLPILMMPSLLHAYMSHPQETFMFPSFSQRSRVLVCVGVFEFVVTVYVMGSGHVCHTKGTFWAHSALSVPTVVLSSTAIIQHGGGFFTNQAHAVSLSQTAIAFLATFAWLYFWPLTLLKRFMVRTLRSEIRTANGDDSNVDWSHVSINRVAPVRDEINTSNPRILHNTKRVDGACGELQRAFGGAGRMHLPPPVLHWEESAWGRSRPCTSGTSDESQVGSEVNVQETDMAVQTASTILPEPR